MKFDRNTVIGVSLLAILFFLFFYFNNKQQQEHQRQTRIDKAREDSIIRANQGKNATSVDSNVVRQQQAVADTQQKLAQAGIYDKAAIGTEAITTVENELFKISFSNKGGQPAGVELKKFKGIDSLPVKLAADAFNKISYRINTGNNQSTETGNLFFQSGTVEKLAEGIQTISFTLNSGDSGNVANAVTHRYTIKPNDYMIGFEVILNQPSQLLSQGDLNLTWQYVAHQQETALGFEKENTQIGYVENGDFDYHTIIRRNSIKFDDGAVNWIGVRQRFFNTFLVANDKFASGEMEWTVPDGENDKTVVRSTANMKVKVPAGNEARIPFQIFYGPSDFKILKKEGQGFEDLVNLGQGPYAFVEPINRYVVLPVWNFIKSFVGSFGLVIALLTLFIRLLISPLSYKSYLSGAKMKALRPEIAKLREKFGSDQQQMSMEQMKLFREAGVNPLGGCIPALLQIPIFFALYSFFNSSVDLRGADFLWATDLSAFDAPIKFGFHIPLLGDHLSLFTITAVITSLLISIYSMSMSPDQNNPLLKWMPYIFPVFLLFIFNRLPSALTWYYTVSNLITLALQFVIQNYIIDHDKILVKIEANRKKPKEKSKWQQRLEEMQEQQKKVRETQQKKK
jgi:YidC/Oxa1 family membrane protein insertase